MINDPEATALAAPEATVRGGRRFSAIWLIPLVALAIAGYLVYVTVSQQGPSITITFKTAEGLQPGKTKIKYKDVEVGTVKSVRLSDDLSHVIVGAEMDRTAEHHLTTETQFWVVRPRLSAGGISGLDTLISGARIEMDPGAGAPSRTFTGLEQPPVIRSDVPGTEYRLQAVRKGALGSGSAIFFRGIQVGQILTFEMEQNGDAVVFTAFVKYPFDQLIRTGTRFWNASGIDVSLSGGGVSIQMESLEALIAGGVAFDTPVAALKGEPSQPGTTFALYRSEQDAIEAKMALKIPYLLHFDGSVRGLRPGASVEFRGIRVGSVTDVRMIVDPERNSINIPVTIEIEPDRIQVVGGEQHWQKYAIIGSLVQGGLRAQLNVASLISGDLYVLLDFFPDAPPAQLVHAGPVPEIPTVPSNIEKILASVEGILGKVAALPLDDLIRDVRGAVQSLNKVVSSPQIPATIAAFGEAAQSAEKTLKQAERTLAAVDGMIGPDARLRQELIQAVGELKNTLRAVRGLADELERNPESLIRGKPGGR